MAEEPLSFFERMRQGLAFRAQEMRTFTEHWGTVGAYAEESLRDWLRRSLPANYAVSSGIVVDPERVTTFDPRTDPASRQVDVLVYDRLTTVPLLDYGGLTVLLPEGVSIALEAKDSHDYDDVTVALGNIQSVRRLNSRIIGVIVGFQWHAVAPVRRRIERYRPELNRSTVTHYLLSLKGRFCALWNDPEEQYEFYDLGDEALAHLWATLLGLLQYQRREAWPGLTRLQEVLRATTITPAAEPLPLS
jgi:hypothetical protein